MKKWNEWTKKQKVTLGVALAVVIVGGAVGTNVYAKNQQEQAINEALATIKKEKVSLEQLEKAISELRDKENPNFLAKEVDLKSLESIEKQIDQLKKEHGRVTISEVKKQNKEVVNLLEDVESNVEAISYQLMTQTKVSQLFIIKEKEFAIKGNEVNLKLPTADDLSLADIEAVVSATKAEGKLMTIPKSTDSDKTWEKSIDALTTEAKKQVELIEVSKKSVADLFKDKKPVDTTDKELVQALKKAVEGIRNEKAKTELLAQLKQVEDAINKKEKNEADKKAKEQVAKESANTESKKQNAGTTEDYAVDGNLNNSNWSGQGSQNQNGGSYTPPANNGGGGYTPPTNNGGGGYTPPTNNGGGGGGTTPPGYDGHADQGELDQQEIDGSNVDHTQNPNSPWG